MPTSCTAPPPTPTETERDSFNRLVEQKRWKAARGMQEVLLRKYPDNTNVIRIMVALLQGTALRSHREAELWCRRGLALEPDHHELTQRLICSLIYQAQFLEGRTLLERPWIKSGPYQAGLLQSRMLLACADPTENPDSFTAALRDCGTRFTDHFVPRPVAMPPLDTGNKKIRIGYYSDELYTIQMMYFLYPLLRHHDRDNFDIYIYCGSSVQDGATDLYRSCEHHWTDISTLDRDERTRRVAADNLDILVAASGNTFDGNHAFLLDHPARIQLGWWISSGRSSGLDCFDALLIDSINAPPGSDSLFTEKLWRLDGPATTFYPVNKMEAVSPSPAQRNGFVTFCSTTRMFRLNPGVIAVWARILNHVPQSRLMIDSLELGDTGCCAALQQQFAAHGIAQDRLDLGRLNQWETFRDSDITLDAFPFSAGTSPCQAMYLGHPVVTLAGIPSHGRLAASHVTWAGHPEWVAHSEEEYITKAVSLASDTNKLAEIRQNLRGDLESSPLMNHAGFSHRLTAAYRAMLEQYQQGSDCS